MKKGTRMIFLARWLMAVCFIVLPSLVYSQVGTVTLGAGNGFGLPGSAGNQVEISLDNQDDRTTGLQFDICRGEDLILGTCETTARTSGFVCSPVRNPSDSDCPGGQGDRMLVYDFSGGFVETGAGPVLTLTYEVDPGAPEGTCQDLELMNVIITSCIDDGEDGCLSGPAYDDVATLPGAFCFTDPTTTTTTSISSTTTTVPLEYRVVLSPLSSTIDSGASLQFTARTTLEGKEVGGTYDWEIVSGSTIGSSIDGNGLFTAGGNGTDGEIEETVRVTDSDHGTVSATARVIITPEVQPTACEVRVNPSAVTVFPGDTVPLSASTLGEDCVPGDYTWSVESAIGSTVDQEGSYTAGGNDTGAQVTDVVTVVDHANGAISGTAVITVRGEGASATVSIFPPTLLGFRFTPWMHFLVIKGENAGFRLRSRITFEPSDDIVPLFHFGFGDCMVAFVILRASPQEGPVQVTVATGEDVVTGVLAVALLPSRLPGNK